MIPEEVITTASRITTILNDMNRNVLVADVRFESSGHSYNSSLVRVDPSRRIMYLDELHPAEGHKQITLGKTLRIHMSLRGVSIRFSTDVGNILSEDEIALYECPYPQEMRYRQRREVFRIRIPTDEYHEVTLCQKHSENKHHGRLVDISAGGFCLEMQEHDFSQYPTGALFYFEDLDLPKVKESLSGKIVLTNRRPIAEPGVVAAGFRFVNQDAASERRLMQAALHYQRESRKQSQ